MSLSFSLFDCLLFLFFFFPLDTWSLLLGCRKWCGAGPEGKWLISVPCLFAKLGLCLYSLVMEGQIWFDFGFHGTRGVVLYTGGGVVVGLLGCKDERERVFKTGKQKRAG